MRSPAIIRRYSTIQWGTFSRPQSVSKSRISVCRYSVSTDVGPFKLNWRVSRSKGMNRWASPRSS